MTKDEELTVRLQQIVKRIPELPPGAQAFIERNILPALEAILNDDLAFLAIVALGENTTVQDWFHLDIEGVLYEASGRLQALSNALTTCAMHVALKDEQEPCDCPECSKKEGAN